MKILFEHKPLFLLFAFLMQAGNSYAQVCDNKFSRVHLKGNTYESLKKIVITEENEIITTGELFDYNKAAHIAKFSANGNLLWSYFYSVDYFSFYYKDFFNNIKFNSIINTSDGGFIAAGSVAEYNDKAGGFKDTLALIAKIDKYGSAVWTKIFRSDLAPESATIANISCNTVIEMSTGDLVAYIATDNGPKTYAGQHSYDKIICLDAEGNTKWSKLLFTGLFDAGGLGLNYKRAITEAADHTILVARAIHKTDIFQNHFASLPGNIHLLALDNITGNVKWETNYAYTVPATDEVYTPELFAGMQLPGGKFSFITNLYVTAGAVSEKKAAQIIINNTGVIEQVNTFNTVDDSPCYVIDAANDAHNRSQVLLLDNNGSRSVIRVNGTGRIILAKGYNSLEASITAKVVASGRKGLCIHSNAGNSFYSDIIVTDTSGNIDCASYDVSMITGNTALVAAAESIYTDFNYNYTADRFGELRHTLKKEDYLMQQNITCMQINPCCHDTIDKTNIVNISICEGKPYTLPDGAVIQDSGLYYVTFKTALGCDSIRFYKVKTDKDVATLSLGNDTCFIQQQPITLRATEGFENYSWMDEGVTGSNDYKVSLPGNYFVSVNNTCGSKTASLHVFELCDFPVYMPNAFSPNDDRVNDVFRIAPADKNQLVSFSIYDRWGSLVFRTTDAASGWNGTYKNEPLSGGTYFYYIEMKGLSGKPVSKKGYVLLIR